MQATVLRECLGGSRRSLAGAWPALESSQKVDPLNKGLPAIDTGHPNGTRDPIEGEVHCVCKAGSCVIMHGDCWHGQVRSSCATTRLKEVVEEAMPATYLIRVVARTLFYMLLLLPLPLRT